MAKVIIGVDPHKLSATIEVVDRHEKLLGCGRFATVQAGYTATRRSANARLAACADTPVPLMLRASAQPESCGKTGPLRPRRWRAAW